MRDAKLILLEGIPGSGKSTTAHALQRQLAALGIPHRWWYEGERGHPLYTFDDAASLQATVADAFSTDASLVQRVVDATLDRWRTLAASLQAGEEVVVFDGMLFGHLGWTLFAGDVRRDTIASYITAAQDAVARVNACLIYLRPKDVSASLHRIATRRGQKWGDDFVRRITNFPYSRRRGLQGFDGSVCFWQDFADLCDDLFGRSPLAKCRTPIDPGDWSASLREARALLDLSEPPEAPPLPATQALSLFAGTYTFTYRGETCTCEVRLEGGALFVTGVPAVWQHTRLAPTSPTGDGGTRFAAEASPYSFTFLEDRNGPASAVREMRLEGPDLVWGGLPRRYLRQQ